MQYKSTRSLNNEATVTSAEAIKNGIAPDGGLYMPTSIPTLDLSELGELLDCSYPERAAYVFAKFLTDYSVQEILSDTTAAYSTEKFPGGAAPLQKIDEKVTALELWHGPTSAFKDMALQIMPRLLSRALKKTGEERTALILVATSGDTGKAALEGYRDVPQIKIKVFYPVDGVSRVQKLQMQTQLGDNVDVTAIYGNFDDAQSGVKKIFADKDVADSLNTDGVFLSSANSINWGRLAPQIAYYVSAYCDMVKEGRIVLGDKIDICVPTGNFGNIFAAYIAKQMGLPFEKLICASNSNNVLTDFLASGTYDKNRHFYTTTSPSMDILISSNLERLLYLVAGSERTVKYMNDLATKGVYTVEDDVLSAIQKTFVGYYASEEDSAAAIRHAFRRHQYLCDTHTAVGYHACLKHLEDPRNTRPIVLASTASPYKFANAVYTALTEKAPSGELEALSELSSLTGTEIPAPLADIASRTVRFEDSVSPDEMVASVYRFVKK